MIDGAQTGTAFSSYYGEEHTENWKDKWNDCSGARYDQLRGPGFIGHSTYYNLY